LILIITTYTQRFTEQTEQLKQARKIASIGSEKNVLLLKERVLRSKGFNFPYSLL